MIERRERTRASSRIIEKLKDDVALKESEFREWEEIQDLKEQIRELDQRLREIKPSFWRGMFK